MICCMYCCTARVESISSKASSGHELKLHILVPGRFLLMMVWLPSDIFVIIFCLKLNIYIIIVYHTCYKTAAPTLESIFVTYIRYIHDIEITTYSKIQNIRIESLNCCTEKLWRSC